MLRLDVQDLRSKKRGRVDHQRHLEHTLVREDAVAGFAMVAERLAVIRRDDHDRVAIRAGGEHRLQQTRERRIRRRYLAKIRIIRPSRAKPLGRFIWEVRFVDVDPGEPGLTTGTVDPLPRERHRLFGGPLLNQKRRPRSSAGEPVLVHVEARIQPESRIEREGADEGARAVAAPAELRGERLRGTREAEPGVVAYAVDLRQLAGQDV